MSLVVLMWVARAPRLSDAFLPSAPFRSCGSCLLNVSCSLINTDLQPPLSLSNFPLFCLLRDYARIAARSEEPGLRQLLPGKGEVHLAGHTR